MTATITLNTDVPTTSLLEYVDASPTASNDLGGRARLAPAFIRADEAYYWSFHWQRDVRESMSALSQGEYEEFASDDPNDIARWMLRVDDC